MSLSLSLIKSLKAQVDFCIYREANSTAFATALNNEFMEMQK